MFLNPIHFNVPYSNYYIYISDFYYLDLLEMCSVSTNGERAYPAQGFQLIGYNFLTIIDKRAHIFPEHQELVHISVHKCIPI